MLEMHDYDLILGMDWLSKHSAKIDYKKNKVTFRPPQKESFTFKSDEIEDKTVTSTWDEAYSHPIQVPVRPVIRARAKKFKEALNGLIHRGLLKESHMINA